MIHLLQAQGELEQAIREYEALIRAAPHNPDYVVRAVRDVDPARRSPARAFTPHAARAASAADDEECLARLADFYERVEEKQKSIAVLHASLRASRRAIPSHLVDLGDRYFNKGTRRGRWRPGIASRQWCPIGAKALGHARRSLPRSRHAERGGRGAERGEPARAARTCPTRRRTPWRSSAPRRTVGATASLRRATKRRARIWEGLLTPAKGDKNLAREARAHIVTLCGLLASARAAGRAA